MVCGASFDIYTSLTTQFQFLQPKNDPYGVDETLNTNQLN